jgi:hypothetical protein
MNKKIAVVLLPIAAGLTLVSPVCALTPDQIAQQREQARQAGAATRELRGAERIRKSHYSAITGMSETGGAKTNSHTFAKK